MAVWIYSEQDRALVRGQKVVRLAAKAGEVLTCLVERRGQVVSRDDIRRAVWSKTHVTPNLVREYIFDLRSALGDDASRPRYIETIRGAGFRLIGDVVLERRTPKIGERIRGPRVAVRHTGGTDENTSSLARDLGVMISQVPGFSVVPHSANGSMIDYMVDCGTANGTGAPRFWLSASSAEGTQICTRFFDLCDKGEIERAIAAAANSLCAWRGPIMRAEAARAARKAECDLGAYDHYVLSLDCERRRDLAHSQRGLGHIERSLELDPGNARAWLALAIMLTRPFMLFGVPLSDAVLSREERALEEAYALDPDDALILCACASARARRGDVGGAVAALDMATTIGQDQADVVIICANLLATVAGDLAGSRDMLRRAQELNPTPREWCRFTVARVSFFSGAHDDCRAAAGPDSKLLPLAIFNAFALLRQGLLHEAREARTAIERRFPEFSFDDYATLLPIVAERPLALYNDSARKLTAL